MPSDNDWVSRDLQRLAKESKLRRKPTEAEWQRIWRAATDWADAVGVITMSMSIEPFVREHAPGVLRELDSAGSDTNPQIPPSAAQSPAPPIAPETLDRTRRSPRSKASGKPTRG